MDPRTHLQIDTELVGQPEALEPGRARVRLKTVSRMAADEPQLVHGGFPFGLADYAAMLAVNEPTVVLGRAEMKFLKPVVVGEELVAAAEVTATDGKKRTVRVEVHRDDELVAVGEFLCLVPDRHVLEPRE